MELYGWARVFSLILQGLYGALRVLVCVFVHFIWTLRSSTGARVCFRHSSFWTQKRSNKNKPGTFANNAKVSSTICESPGCLTVLLACWVGEKVRYGRYAGVGAECVRIQY